MFYNLNSQSDREVRVLRRDRLAPERHQGHGTKDFRWGIPTSVGGRRGELGPGPGVCRARSGIIWLPLLRHHKTGRTHCLLRNLKAQKCHPSWPPFTDSPVHRPDPLHGRGGTQARDTSAWGHRLRQGTDCAFSGVRTRLMPRVSESVWGTAAEHTTPGTAASEVYVTQGSL